MSLTDLIKTPCTITRRSQGTEEDDYGNLIPTTEDVETLCSIQQRATSEPGDQGELSDSTWLGLFFIGEELDTSDAVSTANGSYEVVGSPWRAEEGSEEMWHIEARLRETAGADDGVGS